MQDSGYFQKMTEGFIPIILIKTGMPHYHISTGIRYRGLGSAIRQWPLIMIS